ncbi:MAG: hypothetical protein ACM3XO_06410 [Bacteroidota bacterium]
MLRYISLLAVVILAISIFAASSPAMAPGERLTILPEDCTLAAGEQIFLKLDGSLPSNVVVNWEVDHGGVASILPGSSAVLVAPSAPGVVNVQVSILPVQSGQVTFISRQCIITSTDDISG